MYVFLFLVHIILLSHLKPCVDRIISFVPLNGCVWLCGWTAGSCLFNHLITESAIFNSASHKLTEDILLCYILFISSKILLSKEMSLWIQRPSPPYEKSQAVRAAVIEVDKDRKHSHLPPSLSARAGRAPGHPSSKERSLRTHDSSHDNT